MLRIFVLYIFITISFLATLDRIVSVGSYIYISVIFRAQLSLHGDYVTLWGLNWESSVQGMYMMVN